MKKAKFVKTAIIRVELEYPFLPKYSDEQIKAMMQLIELPENYKLDKLVICNERHVEERE